MSNITRDLIFSQQDIDPINDPSWWGVFQFLPGAFSLSGAIKIQNYVKCLLDFAKQDTTDKLLEGRLLGLAASAIVEQHDLFHGVSWKKTIVDELYSAFNLRGKNWPIPDRVFALDALGQLGDPRLSQRTWQPIMNDSFHNLLMLSRPITVSDFKDFALNGATASKYWCYGKGHWDSELPRNWHQQVFHYNRPVTGISWYAAMAFCQWATEIWKEAKGGYIDLPLENEWEAAATNGSKSFYPWGDDLFSKNNEPLANYDAPDSLRAVTPVGAFAITENSDFMDIIGNVWEWCRLTHESIDNIPPTANIMKPVRGGAWDRPMEFLDPRYAGLDEADGRYDNVGFRVVLRISKSINSITEDEKQI